MSLGKEQSRGADGHPIIPVQSGIVLVPGLRPDAFHREGGFTAGNFDELRPQVMEALNRHSGFKALVKDIKEHKKSAIIITSVGSLTLLVAAVAGYEFGIRHGRDVQQLFPKRNRKNQ
jgi:hypothetical protein